MFHYLGLIRRSAKVGGWPHALRRVGYRGARVIEVLAMLLLLHFRPESAYRLSAKMFLPLRCGKTVRTSNPLDDFEVFYNDSRLMPFMDHANVVMRGASFDREMLSELTGPTFLVNWPEKVDRDNIIYATGDASILDMYKEREMLPIFFITGFWTDFDGTAIWPPKTDLVMSMLSDPRISHVTVAHKSVGRPTPMGSGLFCVVGLSRFSKQMEVYGWDFYLKFEPSQRSYWRALMGMYTLRADYPKHHNLELAVYNWHYAYRFSQMPNFKIHSYLGHLDKHQRLVKRLGKVMYKS